MVQIIRSKIGESQLEKLGQDLEGYIKFVVDIERKIIAAGGQRHFEAEEALIKDGSRQENLWGGGLDLETKEVDFDSIINIRPNQGNPSREVLSKNVRKKVERIVGKLLL